ncbi:penicillin acylase family protein [Amaricoccus tamworthensis]|uniref:penicillin acylase family protein n=1 Tax=Amaricoccus tamworthensis TaxID=57002 RepID=UPI003C7DA083
MAFLFRLVMWIFAVLAMVLLAAAILIHYLLSQSLPDYNRDLVLSGPQEDFEIVRDRHAIPHILAKNDHDAFFGLGLAHAQDRLWQMVVMRRTAQGRLSEVFGRDTFEIDVLMRSLDLYGHSRNAVRFQDEETVAALEAYADGVNAWLRIIQKEALGRGAPELFWFDASIAPWIPADSLALQKLMALQLTDHASREILRGRLSLQLKEERVDDILPEATNAPVMGLPQLAALFEGTEYASLDVNDPHPLSPIRSVGMAGASNAFAASKARTAGQGTLLATDPHLMLTAPSIWYLARMDLQEGPVMGGTIPGIPSILIGRNKSLGWGLTSSYLDDQDVYIEKLNPDNPDQYLTPSGYRDFAVRSAIVKIGSPGSDGEQEQETVLLKYTRNGRPVLTGDHFNESHITPPGHVASLAWTALTGEDRSVAASINLMRARSIREGREAAEDLLAPSQMVTMADQNSVALQMAGAAPKRNAASTSKGRIPSLGWLSVNNWEGMRPFARNPWVVDPPSGIVVNTNNRITDAVFPDHLSFDWGDTVRIARAGGLLAAREIHTLESFIEIQTDTVSEAARTLLPLIARDLWYSGDAAPPDSVAAQRSLALERLANWSGDMSEHDPEPLIYSAWIRALQRRLTVDELGSSVELVAQPDPAFIERVFRNVNGAAVWCDVIQTSARETCSEIARRSLDDALVEISSRFGPRLESWRWGDAHQAVHANQTLGRNKLLSYLVNIRQSTPGGNHTMLRGQSTGRGEEPYLNIHGSGLRAVYDFSDPDSSVFIISTGQSGHLMSRHYDDLAALWRRSEYIPMSLDADLARAGADGITRITVGPREVEGISE